MRKGIVGIGPSMVDISANLSEPTYEQCCEILDATPGEWSHIESFDKVSKLLGAISGVALRSMPSLDYFPRDSNVSIVAGSSILGMFGAMPPDLRSNSTFASTLAHIDGRIDPMSSFFTNEVQNVGLRHDFQLTEGYNPIGFVLSSEACPEKTLGMFPGVANKLDDYSLDNPRPELVILDTYELQEGKIAEFLNRLIQNQTHRIGLSLANHTVIKGSIKDSIRSYIKSGKIDILCGNSLEFQALYPELESGLVTKEGFRDHPIIRDVPFALMTLGEHGLVASWEGKVIDAPAFSIDPQLIINTSGAGDTTAGVFYASIIKGEAPVDTLQKATYYAAKVLQLPGSMIVSERLATQNPVSEMAV